MCAAAGVDWVLLDLEQCAGGEEQVGPVVIAAAAHGGCPACRHRPDFSLLATALTAELTRIRTGGQS